MNIEIANRLVHMRKAKGLSQEALAEQLGISRQAVSKWERAESSPDTSNLITLAKLYNVSLDELLNTDQDEFESGESINEEDSFASTTLDEDDRHDYVNIGMKGIHVKDGEDEVHIGWTGIHVIEDGKKVVRIGSPNIGNIGEGGVTIDGEGVFIDGEEYIHDWKGSGIFSLIIVCIWLWIGFEYALWHPGWLLFLTIPIMSSFVYAIKSRNASHFAYPVLISLGYLYVGCVKDVWHPTWVAFMTIPIYYAAVNKIRNRKS